MNILHAAPALAGLALAALTAAPAAAATALTLIQPGVQDTFVDQYSVGWELYTQSAIDVNSLGFYANAPLNYSHDVGIFNSSGDLLLSATVPSGGAGGSFHYVSVAPTVLPSAQYYYIMAVTSPSANADTETLEYNLSDFSTDPAISYVTRAASQIPSSQLTFPTFASPSSPYGFFGPNFQFTSAASSAPEPSQLAALSLMTFGVLGLILRVRKRAKAAA